MPGPIFVRVKDKDTKHEYSVVESTVDPAAHEVLDKPGAATDGTALPPKYFVSKSGQSATPKKENS